MTTEQRVDRLEKVLEELLAGQKRIEVFIRGIATKLLSPAEVAELERKVESK